MHFSFNLIFIFYILVYSGSLSASTLNNKTYSKDEMAKCLMLISKESFNQKKIDLSNRTAVIDEIERCKTCNLPYSGNSRCLCSMCSYCGSKYGNRTGWHYQTCVCPYCGGPRGRHINCGATDWDGLETHEFQKVLEATTIAININPNNKDAYFNRGIAYFELGNFDESLNDYLSSNEGLLQPKSFKNVSLEFLNSLLSGIQTGSTESALEFIPSLCNTTYGMGRTLWTFVNQPIDSFSYLANSCYEFGEHAFAYCEKINWETIEGYSEQMITICQEFNHLTEAEKGELIGYTLGKYGMDFLTATLTGTTTYKGYTTVRNLKNANRVCNLEAMAKSTNGKKIISNIAKEHALSRKIYFESVKYNYDSHFKHIEKHHYYDGKRSIWQHPDPESLLRRFAGKGQINTGTPGLPGYRESVDFGEHIGIWKENKIGGAALPTTRGIIHYGNKGAHIVPSHPNVTNGVN